MRDAHTFRFDYDLRSIFRDIREMQKATGSFRQYRIG